MTPSVFFQILYLLLLLSLATANVICACKRKWKACIWLSAASLLFYLISHWNTVFILVIYIISLFR